MFVRNKNSCTIVTIAAKDGLKVGIYIGWFVVITIYRIITNN